MEVLNIKKMSVVTTASLLATAGLLAWSATYVAGLVWHVLASDVNVSATETFFAAEPQSNGMADSADGIDLARLQSVFGLQTQGQRPITSGAINAGTTAEQTRLSLTLKGAVLSSDPQQSRAIIASGDSQQGYKPGDSIADMPGSVVLQAVYQTYVLLDNNGLTETLRMDEAPARPDAQASQGAAPTENLQQGNSGQVLDVMSVSGKFSTQAFTDLVRIQPVYESQDSPRAGALRGIQIRHGSRQDFLSAAGLRQGDLITGVNGTALDNPAQLPHLMEQLSSAQTLALQVVRDDVLLTVQLDRTLL